MGHMPPLVKFELESPSGEFPTMLLSPDEFENWEQFDVMMQRKDTSGTFPEFDLPPRFVKEARTLLKSLFDKHGVYAQAVINVYYRDRWILDKYTLIKSSKLNFSTYQETVDYIDIEAMDEDLYSVIKSKGRTKADILVSSFDDTKKPLAEDKLWDCERIKVVNGGTFTTTDRNYGDYINHPAGATHSRDWRIALASVTTELTPGGPEHDIKDQSTGSNRGGDYFFKAASHVNVNLNVSFRWLAAHIANMGVIIGPDTASCAICIGQFRDGTEVNNISFSLRQTPNPMQYIVEFFSTPVRLSGEFEMLEGDTLSFYVTMEAYFPIPSSSAYQYVVEIRQLSRFELTFHSQTNPVPITVIDPEDLLNRLLQIASGEPERFTGSIEWMDASTGAVAGFKTKIVAAESIRGLSQPYIHTSLNDFIQWMFALGYEWSIDGDHLNFRPRERFYRSDIVGLTRTEEQVTDLTQQAHKDVLYTGVKVGYEKQDYDNDNGRLEANVLYEYQTPYTSERENILDLESPYRADSIGIELMLQARSLKTTRDTTSDNDVFFVALTENNKNYTWFEGFYLEDQEYEGIKLYNAPYHPYFLIKYSESLIGVIAQYLRFSAAEGGRNSRLSGVYSGIDLQADVEITKQLFEPTLLAFRVGSRGLIPMDRNTMNGLIQFPWHGETFRGFVQKIGKNYSMEQEMDWILLKAR